MKHGKSRDLVKIHLEIKCSLKILQIQNMSEQAIVIINILLFIVPLCPPQKTQSNGQPVAVAQVEVKVTEAVSKQAPQIKAEKVHLRSCRQK